MWGEFLMMTFEMFYPPPFGDKHWDSLSSAHQGRRTTVQVARKWCRRDARNAGSSLQYWFPSILEGLRNILLWSKPLWQ
jgi:hypothetical protein